MERICDAVVIVEGGVVVHAGTLADHETRLRAKLDDGAAEPYFTTEHGLGYRLG